MAVRSPFSEVEQENQRANVVFQQVALCDNQEFLVFAISTIAKAVTTETETAHRIKNTELSCGACRTPGEKNKDLHWPQNLE